LANVWQQSNVKLPYAIDCCECIIVNHGTGNPYLHVIGGESNSDDSCDNHWIMPLAEIIGEQFVAIAFGFNDTCNHWLRAARLEYQWPVVLNDVVLSLFSENWAFTAFIEFNDTNINLQRLF